MIEMTDTADAERERVPETRARALSAESGVNLHNGQILTQTQWHIHTCDGANEILI